jgi:hypothetical protein
VRSRSLQIAVSSVRLALIEARCLPSLAGEGESDTCGKCVQADSLVEEAGALHSRCASAVS